MVKAPVLDVSDQLPAKFLGSGTADGTKFLRGDRVWSVPDYQGFHDSHFQVGTANFVNSKTVAVIFGFSFGSAPKVFVTPINDPLFLWWAKDITVSGFTVELQSVATVTFQWMAIER